jgi:nucleoside-diphosphate-sugar epimerase
MSTGRQNSMVALVVGSTGIAGDALCAHLVDQGWAVLGLSRRGPSTRDGVTPLVVDLTDAAATVTALSGLRPTHVFFTAWTRMPTEQQNIAVNGAMVRDVLAGVAAGGGLRHVGLVTGLKHYMGPFEAYGTGEVRDTPFHEDEPRLDVPNFYYAQEDELWDAADKQGFTWSVHRSHTIIGHAIGNAMNMGLTLAVQAALSKRRGTPFVFPGNETQWTGLTDMTDAGLLARHLVWAATTPAAADLAFNVANGDVFRWRWLWPRLAELLQVRPEGYADRVRPLSEQLESPQAAREWTDIAERAGLVEPNLDRVASWWHTDGDLSRPVECFTDMSRSRRAGFTEQISTLDSFAALYQRLRRERVIPA